ncbi:glucose-6-phosphate dehydrogenase [Arthrobacter sp. A5]|uniref:glucose-6-phosphate dehydrogenase n=1 Tax=Arthrobacter sp. A5 TaxID=576926 RepID=UPI003DA9F9A0
MTVAKSSSKHPSTAGTSGAGTSEAAPGTPTGTPTGRPTPSSSGHGTSARVTESPLADTDGAIRTLLILGASGDLTGRLLLPGVARLIAAGRASGISLVGAGSDDWTAGQWTDRVSTTFAEAAPAAKSGGKAALAATQKGTSYHTLDVTAPGELAKLLATLRAPIAVYFALPPAVSQRACEVLTAAELPPGTRLVMEKPFGSGEASARALNHTLAGLVPEDHIHRVDHFLGKSTVFNILGLRFANRLLEPLWNSSHIAKVEIVFDEALTLENRARYYDRAGALRDMIQSHLLQVMAIMAMEAPATLHERDVRDGIAAVLRASSISDDFTASTRRARYTTGNLGARKVPDYVAEDGVDPANNTETLAEVEVRIQNWRWAGVPFILRSGKSLGKAQKEVVITYRPVPHLPTGFKGVDRPTRLHLGLGPDVLKLDLDVNGPGDLFTLDRVFLETDLASDELLPYGEVLDGVLNGDPLLSVRGDTAEQCWRIVEPTLKAWRENKVPLQDYPAGSSGPADWETSKSSGKR